MSRRALAVLSLSLGAVVLSGCSAATAPASSPSTSSVAPTPVTIDNCGFEVTVERPPERILTIKSTTTEMLLALGLGDRIIGTAFPDGPVPEQWAAEAADIPVISDFAPAQEAVLDLEPDFIYAGWESNLTSDTAGERDALASLGVGSYVSPSACKEPGYKPEKLTFDLVFDEIREAGTVFSAEAAAEDLVAEQQQALAALSPSTAGLTALWYSSGTDTPYVGAGIGAPQMMLQAAGLTNVAADVADTWASLGWESIIDANPDVIVLVDASWNTAASKIEMLTANPVTAQLSAVAERRFITVPFAAGEAGVRNVEAVRSILDQLAALDAR
ncbi:putative F420-0 ABC transporter substrate-binding protein [Salinibacterium sp. ZJ454]|uniref:putative F420-0 ABC transporter substrate-binding protein n=1 Tax=Salinibacterium sp. ZJ454 TaxID=2708339 RepID=UPI00142017E0|nr:putative F420-0 ABC transporter substrate-binding protein [Salinibacterium sp. ZJ454]